MSCGCKGAGGKTPDKALLFGEDDGSDPIEVVATASISQQPAGHKFWAKGNQLQTIVEAGWLRPTN